MTGAIYIESKKQIESDQEELARDQASYNGSKWVPEGRTTLHTRIIRFLSTKIINIYIYIYQYESFSQMSTYTF
jgi:hypothetical protein